MFTKKTMTKAVLGLLAVSSLVSSVTLADDYMYVRATHLNVRASNTFRSSIVATVDNGYQVTVLESLNSGWKKVLLQNGKIGYMNGRYLSSEAPYYEKALGAYYTVDVPHAFLRADGLVRKIAVLEKGDTLEIMDEKIYLGKWIRVKVASSMNAHYDGRVGYVSKKLVRVNEDSRYMAQSDSSDWIATPEGDSWIADMPTHVRSNTNMNAPTATDINTNTGTGTPKPTIYVPNDGSGNVLDDWPEGSNDAIGNLLDNLLK